MSHLALPDLPADKLPPPPPPPPPPVHVSQYLRYLRYLRCSAGGTFYDRRNVEDASMDFHRRLVFVEKIFFFKKYLWGVLVEGTRK